MTKRRRPKALRFDGFEEFQSVMAAVIAAPTDCFSDLAAVAQISAEDLRGADLSGMDLSGVSLEATDLRDIDFHGAKLQGASLRYCNLARADLRQADFRNADLSECFLVGANAGGAIFDRASLENSDVRQMKWQGASFTDALINGLIADSPPPGFDFIPRSDQSVGIAVALDAESLSPTFGRFSAGPFERGFGVTVGNAMRRCLLSAIGGAAVTAVRIEGVPHEFSALPGVVEDITDVILNLKQIPMRLLGEETGLARLEAEGPKDVTAADLALDGPAEVMDKDIHIATLSEGGELKLEAIVRYGRGYVSADRNFDATLGSGWIPLDSAHSPVRRANYRVEPVRLGSATDYERLVLEVTTTGATSPQRAASMAAAMLRDHLSGFLTTDHRAFTNQATPEAEHKSGLDVLLEKTLDDLDLSVRSASALKSADIHTLRDLVRRSEQDLLQTKQFGRKSLEEVQQMLRQLGLSVGMHLRADL